MPEKQLGKLEAKHDARNLMAAKYIAETPPASYDFMRLPSKRRRSRLPARTFGNNDFGDCTLASQANALMRFERVEQRRTIIVPQQHVIDNYLQMTGGQDSGWYELDALKRWHSEGFDWNPNRKYTIDAFAQVNVDSADEIRAAMYAFRLIKICFGLPNGWKQIDPEGYGDAGPNGDHIWSEDGGDPWSWGGHSMMADAYDEDGIWVVHTWFEGDTQARQLVTWEAVAKYADEAYSLVDSIDEWRSRPRLSRLVDLDALEKDVEEVTAA
jgi:hypothetical protein